LNYRLPDTKIRQDTVMALGQAELIAASNWRGAGTKTFSASGRVTVVRR
jgi:hypothetical protein